MTIIGIDPALRETGIAVLEITRVKLLTFKWSKDVEGYASAVYNWCQEHELLAQDLIVEWPPQEFHGRKPQTRLLAFCSGVWANAIPTKRTRIYEPKQWYRALWGHDQATESMIFQEAINCCRKFDHAGPADPHQADALCLALTAINPGGGDDEAHNDE